jgi:hypothetical protein
VSQVKTFENALCDTRMASDFANGVKHTSPCMIHQA